MNKYYDLGAIFCPFLIVFWGSPVWANICVPEPGEKLRVIGVASDDTLSVRQGYSTQYKVVTELLPNQKSIEYVDVFYKSEVCAHLCANYLEITSSKGFSETNYSHIESECRSKSKIWYKISSNGGIQGWASAKYLEGYWVERESDQQENSIQSEVEHVVAEGDTAYSISREYGISLSELASLNSLDSNYSLRLGQTLVLSTNLTMTNNPINGGVEAFEPASELEGDLIVDEAQSIFKGFGYSNLVVNGKYDSDTIKVLEGFFKDKNESYAGGLDPEELMTLQDRSNISENIEVSDLKCNNSICTTTWGAWITKTSIDNFEEEVLNKYLEYVSAYDRVNQYLRTDQKSATRDLLDDGRSLLKKYSEYFYCHKADDSILSFDFNTRPGAAIAECDSNVVMMFPKLVFDDYQCVWSGYYDYDNCYFQWIKKYLDEKDVEKQEVLIRLRMTLPPLDSDQLYDGDILLISGEIDHYPNFDSPDIEISRLTQATKIAETAVEFGGNDNRNLSDNRFYEYNFVFYLLQDLVGGRYPMYSEGFYYGHDIFDNYKSGISAKLSEFPQDLLRAQYVKNVLTAYEPFLACAEYGLLGEFSVDYVKSKFKNSALNDLTKLEINSLTQQEIIGIRTLLKYNDEACKSLVAVLLLNPKYIDEIFQRN